MPITNSVSGENKIDVCLIMIIICLNHIFLMIHDKYQLMFLDIDSRDKSIHMDHNREYEDYSHVNHIHCQYDWSLCIGSYSCSIIYTSKYSFSDDKSKK
jgi:hypothetical protein